MAHEYGHNFGLSHQSDYNLLGVKTNEYSSGFDVTLGPGQEIDVSFTPTATGRYGLSDGAATVSALVVG